MTTEAEFVLPNITGAAVNWYEGYANSPTISVYLDGDMPPSDQWVWHKYQEPNARASTLVTTNFRPWVKFRHISDPNTPPPSGGALGGTFKLDDGTEFESRGGWSSRAGAMNIYKDQGMIDLPDYLVEVTVYEPSAKIGWAGFSLLLSEADKVMDKYLSNLFLIPRHRSHESEPVWTPSTAHDKIQKPSGYVCT